MSQILDTYRFSVEEYHRLGEVGILGENDRIELLDGELLIMSPIGKRHAKAVRNLNQLFARRVGNHCVVDCQNPFILSARSEPQPDFLLLRPEMLESDELPRPEDIFLLLEVADSSISYDRGVKLQFYAEAGVREVWILNLTNDVVECYREPQGRAYLRNTMARRGETLEVEALPGTSFAVADLLP